MSLKQTALFETLRYEPDVGYLFLEAHCRRMADSAHIFQIPCHAEMISDALTTYIQAQQPSTTLRVRCLLAHDGKIIMNHSTLQAPFIAWADVHEHEPVNIAIHTTSLAHDNHYLQHKSTHMSTRIFYDNALAVAQTNNPALYELIFMNERGLMTEGCFHNIVIEHNSVLTTPYCSDGCLPGIMRAILVANGHVTEAHIGLNELTTADNIYCINSVRGWRRARLINKPSGV